MTPELAAALEVADAAVRTLRSQLWAAMTVLAFTVPALVMCVWRLTQRGKEHAAELREMGLKLAEREEMVHMQADEIQLLDARDESSKARIGELEVALDTATERLSAALSEKLAAAGRAGEAERERDEVAFALHRALIERDSAMADLADEISRPVDLYLPITEDDARH